MKILGVSWIGWLFLAFIAIYLGLPLLSTAHPRPAASRTKRVMSMIVSACEAYRFDFGVYPPDKATINGTILNSSECLNWYLTTAFRLAPKEGDRAASNDAGPYLEQRTQYFSDIDRNGFKEVLDAWGKPWVYDNIKDDPRGLDFCGADDPRRDKKPRNLDSFDLFTQPTSGSGKIIANFNLDE
jgi:hypothetical protein